MDSFSIYIRKSKNIGHFFLGRIATFWSGNPSKDLKVIGVTGTDGKTTTSYFIYQLLTLAGKKTALISTVGVFLDGQKQSLGFHATTPSSFKLNKYIKNAKSKEVDYLILEVSSHALDQHRVTGIKFDIGTITNITNEHLDYHKTFENYLQSKIKLLRMSKIVVLNKQDKFFPKIKKEIGESNLLTYSLLTDSDLDYSEIKNSYTESLTEYNKNNLLSALLIVKSLGVDISSLNSKFSELSLPEGRLEYLKTKPFKVLVDFAHTPNSFKVLLPEIRKATRGRIIHVFGSAGKRDKSKRPIMGQESSQYSDIIILTAEDPRNESVESINNDVRKGIDKKFRSISKEEINSESKKFFVEIANRKEAIQFALSMARENDCVVITGKGPEESMNIGGKEIPWNDIKVTKALIKENERN